MLIPQITFNETNTNSNPIRSNVRNRIGIVGQFSRGPANFFTFIDGFTDFSTLYGSDTTTGSIAYQAAYDQGAREFGIVRVLGNSTPAKGEVILGGVATKPNTIKLNIVGIKRPVVFPQSFFINDINSNGVYTGTQSGRYIFVVTGANEIKYKFIPYSLERNDLEAFKLVTTAVLTDIVSNTDGEGILTVNAPGSAIPVEKGLSIILGNVGESLLLQSGNKFLITVESYNYSIGITENQSAIDIGNNLISNLSGLYPLNNIVSQLQYIPNNVLGYSNTISFNFDNDIITGADGNNYYYRFDLEESDGLFALDLYWDGINQNQLLTNDVNALLLEAGDTIQIPSSNKFSSSGLSIPVNATVINVTGTNPYVIELDSSFTHSSGIYAGASEVSAQDAFLAYFKDSNLDGISLSSYKQYTPFTNGVDGPRFANKSLYSFTGIKLIQFSAISQGQWGNNLSLSIRFLGGSKYEVLITDNQGINFNPVVSAESYIIDLTQEGAVDDSGLISAFNNSKLVRAFFVPKVLNSDSFNVNLLKELPVRLAPPNALVLDTKDPSNLNFYGTNVLQNITLESGFDGPVVTENDFVLAIKKLEGQQVNIILAPGIYTNSPLVQSELVSIAESSSEIDALKIAVLSARPNLKPNNAFKEISGINSKRAVCVAGWSTYGGQPNVRRFGLSPDALYAGVLASIGFSISPAAKTSSGPVFNITEVDTEFNTSNNSLQLYTDGRLEVLYPDINQGGFFFLNGRTTSSNPAWDRITIRRTYDVIRQDLRTGLMSYLSEPHTKLLRKQIETSVNAYFQSLLRGNKIANYLPAIANESNNPPENYINGEINVSISFLPLYAADYINVTITRNTAQGLSINDF